MTRMLYEISQAYWYWDDIAQEHLPWHTTDAVDNIGCALWLAAEYALLDWFISVTEWVGLSNGKEFICGRIIYENHH